MDASIAYPVYQDRTRAIAALGILLLLGGIAVGLLGPLEMYCFYLFSAGGRFHYEGFGFGSFMFGNIASQIVGYYILGALGILLGYGHLRMRRWARTLSLALLWSWLVVGAPLVVVVFFILAGSKDLSLPAALSALGFLLLSYLLFPWLLIRFYRGRNVTRTFEARDAAPSRIEAVPLSVLVLALLDSFYVIVMHILILFNGIFPVLGAFRFGLQGIVLIDLSIACLAGLIWGTLRQRRWAWWGSVLWLGLFAFSTVLAFCRTTWPALLAGLAFPAREVEFLRGVPAQGYHLALLAGIPLVATWVLALLSRRYLRFT